MVESKARGHNGKVRAWEGKSVDVALLPANVAQPLFGLCFARLIKHRRSQIDAHCVPHHSRESTGQQPRSASHVQRCVVWTGLSQLHDPLQRLLIADGLSLGKGNSLASELL